MSDLSNTDGKDLMGTNLRFNNNPKYDRQGDILKMSGLTNIEKGWVNEWQFFRSYTKNGMLYYELKLMLDTDVRPRIFIETGTRYKKSDKVIPTGLEVSESAIWIITFINLKGTLQKIPLLTEHIWRLISTNGVERLTNLPVGHGGKRQYKDGYAISFYMLLRFINEEIFGLDDNQYWLDARVLSHRKEDKEKYVSKERKALDEVLKYYEKEYPSDLT